VLDETGTTRWKAVRLLVHGGGKDVE